MVQVHDGGQSYQLEGRAAAMIAFIVRKAARMNEDRGKMKLEFHCKGNSIRPRLEFYEDEDVIRVR
jgi:hypothetical protein